MSEIANLWFIFLVLIMVVQGCRKSFQIGYYETLLERYELEVGVTLPPKYHQVKFDFWVWLKR